MDIAAEIIKKSLISKNGVLCEDDAKKVLKTFSIPVVSETRACTVDEAVTAANKYGFPVVLKGLGSLLTHKSEMGLVRVGLASDDEVRNAADYFIKTAGQDLEGILVQPMVKGERELVAGMFKDPQFGPVIMFGLGGIFTEALNDVVFRLAPLQEIDIEHMMEELLSKALLKDFRGEKSADREQIKAVLSGLSDIAMKFPEIYEIDINPLIVTSNGSIKAVDALIITGREEKQKYQRPVVEKKALGKLFYPDSVAFVGASATLGKWGHMLLTNTLSGGYKGDVYFVNPKTEKGAVYVRLNPTK